jgi:hypothetical protein
MGNYLTASGPLIWLVILLGVLAVGAAALFARGRKTGHRQLALGATAASVIVALLATIVGFQKSVGGLREVAADDRWIYLWGLSESLNNMVVALVFAMLASVVLMVGSYRDSSAPAL